MAAKFRKLISIHDAASEEILGYVSKLRDSEPIPQSPGKFYSHECWVIVTMDPIKAIQVMENLVPGISKAGITLAQIKHSTTKTFQRQDPPCVTIPGTPIDLFFIWPGHTALSAISVLGWVAENIHPDDLSKIFGYCQDLYT